MKRETAQEPLFGIRSLLPCLLVQIEDALQRRLYMRTKRISVLDRLGREKPAAQDFRHVFLHDGLDGFLALALEDVVEFALKLPPEGIALARVARQQRRHDAAPVHFRGRLSQILEEVDHSVLPLGVRSHLLAHIHQHFVDEDQDAQPLLDRHLQQLGHQVLRRRRVALFGLVLRMEQFQAVIPGDLPRQNAPRLLERAFPSLRITDFHPLFDVQFVEAKPGDPRLGRGLADGFTEFRHRRQLGQSLRVVHQVAHRDKRVRLAATVGQFELADSLVVLPGDPQRHVPHELPQVVGREGQGKELLGVFVDGAFPALHQDLVKVGGEHVHRQFARLQVVAQRHDFMPAFPGVLRHDHCSLSLSAMSSSPKVILICASGTVAPLACT